MLTKATGTAFLVLTISILFSVDAASNAKPTCEETPERRDCVKVEDPDAKPPKPSVYRNPKPPGPSVQPLPAGPKPRAQ